MIRFEYTWYLFQFSRAKLEFIFWKMLPAILSILCWDQRLCQLSGRLTRWESVEWLICDALRQESSVHIQVARRSHYKVSAREAGTGTNSTYAHVYDSVLRRRKYEQTRPQLRKLALKQAHRSERLCWSHTTHPPVIFDGGSLISSLKSRPQAQLRRLVFLPVD